MREELQVAMDKLPEARSEEREAVSRGEDDHHQSAEGLREQVRKG